MVIGQLANPLVNGRASPIWVNPNLKTQDEGGKGYFNEALEKVTYVMQNSTLHEDKSSPYVGVNCQGEWARRENSGIRDLEVILRLRMAPESCTLLSR